MFLHLGADVVVNLKEVVAILDLRTAGAAGASRAFLELTRSQQGVVDISDGDPKSLVLTGQGVFLSPISSLTLKKRGDSMRADLLDIAF